MNTNYVPALKAILPGVSDGHLYSLDATLENAERSLSQAIEEATMALSALRNAKVAGKAGDAEHANQFLGEAFSIATNPGASGTVSSKIEKANASLLEARTTVRTLFTVIIEA